MPICSRLQAFLEREGVAYTAVDHPLAFSAQDVARAVHVGARTMVKTIVVDADGRTYMVAVAASQRVSPRKLQDALGASHVRLKREDDLAAIFEDCEPGAMPPFGVLYDMPVVADPVLWMDEDIEFNAGDHLTVVKMKFADYVRLVHPIQAEITGEPDEDLYWR